MSGTSVPYVRHYDNHLLDDIHNFFPELLYGDINQFRSVADVLLYMRRQVRSRMDLFTAGARAHHAAAAAAAPPAPSNPLMATPPPIVRLRTRSRLEVPPSPAPSSVGDLLGALDLMNMLVNPNSTAPTSILNSLFNGLPALGAGGGPAAAPGFLEPVVVRPTAQQIAENTIVEIMDAEEEVCAICQDEMPAGSEARSLNACDHRFHVGCIDTWFMRDVHCPVCRHDVRQPAAGVGAPGVGAPEAPSAE